MSKKPAETFDTVSVRSGGSFTIDPETGKPVPNPDEAVEAAPELKSGNEPSQKKVK